MECKESIAIMHERLSGAADAGGAAFDAHLTECGRCRMHYSALLELARLSTQIPRPVPPVSLRRRVSARVAPQPIETRADRRWLILGFAAAACVLLGLITTNQAVWHVPLGDAADLWAPVWGAVEGAFATVSDALGGLFGAEWLTGFADWVSGTRPILPLSTTAAAGIALAAVVFLALNTLLVQLARRSAH